jgi:two-component sensor histidine kinase
MVEFRAEGSSTRPPRSRSRGKQCGQTYAGGNLLRELQHRVKNNFQTIIASLHLQRWHVSPDLRERFQGVMDRLHAIALTHDQLSLDKTAAKSSSEIIRGPCAPTSTIIP